MATAEAAAMKNSRLKAAAVKSEVKKNPVLRTPYSESKQHDRRISWSGTASYRELDKDDEVKIDRTVLLKDEKKRLEEEREELRTQYKEERERLVAEVNEEREIILREMTAWEDQIRQQQPMAQKPVAQEREVIEVEPTVMESMQVMTGAENMQQQIQ